VGHTDIEIGTKKRQQLQKDQLALVAKRSPPSRRIRYGSIDALHTPRDIDGYNNVARLRSLRIRLWTPHAHCLG
jgi:hypothetical protein